MKVCVIGATGGIGAEVVRAALAARPRAGGAGARPSQAGQGRARACSCRPLRGRLMSAFVARIVPHEVEAKRREYEVFANSGLDWTLVRPPRVVDGAATGRRVVGDRLSAARVTQGDVGDVMVELLTGDRFREQAP